MWSWAVIPVWGFRGEPRSRVLCAALLELQVSAGCEFPGEILSAFILDRPGSHRACS